jgi:hypothetical protein
MGSLIQAPGTLPWPILLQVASVPAVPAAPDPDVSLAQAVARGAESLPVSLLGAASIAPRSLHSSPQVSGEAGGFLPGASCVAQVPWGLGCVLAVGRCPPCDFRVVSPQRW